MSPSIQVRIEKQFKILLFALGLVFCAAGIFAQDTGLPERFIQIEDMTGDVQIKLRAESNWGIAEKGMRFSKGGEIRTGPDARAVISIDEDASAGKIDVYANTWIRAETLSYSEKEKAKLTVIDLALGQVLVTAENVADGGSFQIRTPTSTSSVKGNSAVFEVKVEEK